jgi:polysaccharide export outer membrane protein
MTSFAPSVLRHLALLAALCPLLPLAAQTPAAPAPSPAQERPVPVYLLGPNDVIIIRALNAEELSDKPFKIEADGTVNLPLVGRLRAGGLTVEQFEASLTDVLKKVIRDPEVTVSVAERARVSLLQQTVAVVGAFKSTGFLPLIGRDTVMDVITRAGGLAPNASRRIKLTRRADQGAIPLPTAAADPASGAGTVEIALNASLELVNPAENLELKPFDTLTASKLEMVYISGEIARNGALSLEDRDSLSVAQVLSMSGGLTPNADGRKAYVLRQVLNTARRAEVPLDVKAIMSGQAPDFPLLPNDVLVVPRSGGKTAFLGRTALYAVGPLITTLIYIALR